MVIGMSRWTSVKRRLTPSFRRLVSLSTDQGRARLLLALLIVAAAVGVAWLGRQSYVVHQLRRGVGDTWFHTADGRRWFRLDEQRQDVPLDAIAPHLGNAFVAVEDHRFFMHHSEPTVAMAAATAHQHTMLITVLAKLDTSAVASTSGAKARALIYNVRVGVLGTAMARADRTLAGVPPRQFRRRDDSALPPVARPQELCHTSVVMTQERPVT